MAILNKGGETFKNDLVEFVKLVQDQRQQFCQRLHEINLSARGLFEWEAVRLARKWGADDPRSQAMAARVDHRLELVDALEVEVQIAKVRTPVVESTSALVHGRIVNERMKGIDGVNVGLLSERKENLGVPAVPTDDTGYFALEIKPEVLAKLPANQRILLSVASEKGQVIPSAVQPFTIKAGDKIPIEAVLTPAELVTLFGRFEPGRPPSRPTPKPTQPITPAKPVVTPTPAPSRPITPVRPVVKPVIKTPPKRTPPVKPRGPVKRKGGK